MFSQKNCVVDVWPGSEKVVTTLRRLGWGKIIMLKTCWIRLQDISSRRLKDQQMFAGNVFLSLFSKAAIIRKNYNAEARDESNHVKENSIYFKPTLHFTLHKKWSFPWRISLLMWPNPQETADLVTFTEEILNGKLHFLCSFSLMFPSILQ